MYCSVFIPNEDPNYTNVLSMLHVLPKDPPAPAPERQTQPQLVVHQPFRPKQKVIPTLAVLDYQPVIAIHRDTQDYAEENGHKLFQGRRSPQYGPHVKYELKVTNRNASQPFEGIYMCSLERRMDKMYVRSSLTMYGNLSPLPVVPQVDFMSCENDNYVKLEQILTLPRNRETCIRCRGIGFPQPKVGIYRDNQEILTNKLITVSKYINVADGGVAEATYVLRDHNALQRGQHTCRAINDHGSTNIHFKVM